MPCDAKFSEKCLCSHNDKTAAIKHISLFDTANKEVKTETWFIPPPLTIKEHFTPILLGLNDLLSIVIRDIKRGEGGRQRHRNIQDRRLKEHQYRIYQLKGTFTANQK